MCLNAAKKERLKSKGHCRCRHALSHTYAPSNFWSCIIDADVKHCALWFEYVHAIIRFPRYYFVKRDSNAIFEKTTASCDWKVLMIVTIENAEKAPKSKTFNPKRFEKRDIRIQDWKRWMKNGTVIMEKQFVKRFFNRSICKAIVVASCATSRAPLASCLLSPTPR